MDKFKNLDAISNRLDSPIKNLYDNLLEGHTGGSVTLITEIEHEMRLLKKEIERLINMKHEMFKHVVALNTYTEPFLSLKPNDQRAIIEQLLGITVLSEKAETLKEEQKVTRDAIKEEEYNNEVAKCVDLAEGFSRLGMPGVGV